MSVGEHGVRTRQLWELLERARNEWPDEPAIEAGDGALTFGQLHDRVASTSVAMAERGWDTGTSVALLFDNTVGSTVTFLAAARRATRLVPLEPGASPRSIASLTKRIGHVSLVGSSERIAALQKASELSDVEHHAVQDLKWDVPVAESGADPSDPERPFLLQYTSGSTGLPKLAMHSQGNLVRGGEMYRDTFQVSDADRILVAVPLLHSFGLVSGLITSLLTGARLRLLDRFSPQRLVAALPGATILVANPLIYDMVSRSLAGQPDPRSDLRLCLSSGGPLSPKIAAHFRERTGRPIQQVYGSTEAGLIAAQSEPDSDVGVGRPAPGVRVRVLDEDGNPVQPGQPGFLYVRTPGQFAGYLNQDEVTDAVVRDGWYATGDLATLDEDGQLHLVGRKNTFINVSGKKVNPVEIEDVLVGHPAVVEALVRGQATDNGEEVVRADVVVSASVSASALVAFCRERLLPHEVPTRFEFVSQLPRTAMGKLRRSDDDGDSELGEP